MEGVGDLRFQTITLKPFEWTLSRFKGMLGKDYKKLAALYFNYNRLVRDRWVKVLI